MRMRCVGLLAVWLSLGVVACAATQDWKEHTTKEGRFKIKFPGDPIKQEQNVPTGQGQLQMHILAVEADGGNQAFMVMYNDYPEAHIKDNKPDDLLKLAKDGVLSSSNGKVSKERAIKVDGHPGLEFAFEGNSGGREMKCSWRVYLVKNRLYQLAIIRFGQATAPDDVKRFFDSFSLTN